MATKEVAPQPLTRRLLAAHLAPAVFAWVYVAWILLAYSEEDGHHPLAKELVPVQVVVCALCLAGGVWAFRLPTRALRIGIAVATLSGGVVLFEGVGLVLFMP